MEREWPQESRRRVKEDCETKALCLESVGCWIPHKSMISSAADSSPSTSNLTFPPYEPSFTIATSSSSSSYPSAFTSSLAIVLLFAATISPLLVVGLVRPFQFFFFFFFLNIFLSIIIFIRTHLVQKTRMERKNK